MYTELQHLLNVAGTALINSRYTAHGSTPECPVICSGEAFTIPLYPEKVALHNTQRALSSRFYSIVWHNSLLQDAAEQMDTALDLVPEHQKIANCHNDAWYFKLNYLFEDILFNIISGYDYLGNYMRIGLFPHHKEGTGDWPAFQNLARGKNIKDAAFRELLEEVSSKTGFYRNLRKIRGDAIHRNTFYGEIQIPSHSMSERYSVKTRVCVHEDIKTLLAHLVEDTNLSLEEAAPVLIKKAQAEFFAILTMLKTYAWNHPYIPKVTAA